MREHVLLLMRELEVVLDILRQVQHSIVGRETCDGDANFLEAVSDFWATDHWSSILKKPHPVVEITPRKMTSIDDNKFTYNGHSNEKLRLYALATFYPLLSAVLDSCLTQFPVMMSRNIVS